MSCGQWVVREKNIPQSELDLNMKVKRKLKENFSHRSEGCPIPNAVPFRPTRELFSHIKTSALLMKDYKFLPILGIHGNWAGRASERVTPTMTRGIRSYSHLLPSVWQWNCHCLILWYRFFAAGIRTPNLSRARRPLLLTVPQPRPINCR